MFALYWPKSSVIFKLNRNIRYLLTILGVEYCFVVLQLVIYIFVDTAVQFQECLEVKKLKIEILKCVQGSI